MITNKINFPEFTGVSCKMMPFIQGDSSSLPETYKSYAKIIEENYLEKNEIGFLTIDESFVKASTSQRGYNSSNINRNVHIEVGKYDNKNRWGGTTTNIWGKSPQVILKDDTMVLIANNVSNTCRVWDTLEHRYTVDGDLSMYIEDYPEETGILLAAGEVAKISIFTPHECVIQDRSSNRQFFRIVGKGVTGRESYFTVNPLIN